MPGSGLDERQCTLQLCFSPEGYPMKFKIIFRGKGKQIKALEKKAYHPKVDIFWQENAWADTSVSCEWVEKTLKPAVSSGEEFILICDNLIRTSVYFKDIISKIHVDYCSVCYCFLF